MPDYTRATVSQLADFDTVIDVRSPAEFAEDHVPGAINCPVLDNEERIRVGTLYKQDSPFAARKIGAALVARNIARHLDEQLSQFSKSWKPLIYCWRGGQRSGAFTHILREIGWSARRLEGGYKSWRHHVLVNLETLPRQFDFRVVAGPTGSGKSRLLEALAARGAQVLHLEELAAHKGSVLGNLPDVAQPSQKMFETRLYSALAGLQPERPVFVEAESRRIGALRLPDALNTAIHDAPCLRIEASLPARVEFLLEDYAYLCTPGHLPEQLERLKEMQGKERILHWQTLAGAGEYRALVVELLRDHYDPLYARSQQRNLAQLEHGVVFVTADLSPAGLQVLAGQVLDELRPAA
ncbi:MAG: tRNA 2-selenouridine synthase [Proteobacteria bacterium]|nr:tRNA 2-selenouridine synthase [Pseudomonadota bacterium]